MRSFNSLIILFCISINAQTILNSERVLSKIDSVLVVGASIDGDFSYGNLNLIQTNFNGQIGKKINNSVLRGVFNYAYTSENKEVLSNDWSGQLRLNRIFNSNSIFFFLQGQNVKSLNLKSRYLIGGGYRMNLYKNSSDYFDFSLGIFSENEVYNYNDTSLSVSNFRYSLSFLSSIKVFKKLNFNNTLYCQINTKSFSDFRLYFEPRFNYSLNDNFELFFTVRSKYHSTPYIEIKSSDYQSSFGIEFSL
jgi:hypothetical protein